MNRLKNYWMEVRIYGRSVVFLLICSIIGLECWDCNDISEEERLLEEIHAHMFGNYGSSRMDPNY